ncbi:MAG: carboxymuconolactone decarboxylase family protein [Terriglobales bacterium]
MARRHGWNQETLDRLDQFEQLPLLDEPAKTALRFAERMTRDSNAVDDGLYALLRQHFDEAAIVEIAAVVGLFNYFNRFNNVLQMEPTRPGER